MTAKTRDGYRTYELGDINEYPVVTSNTIYEGGAVGDNGSGLARPLVAADAFLGFCEQQANNSIGASSAVNVRVKDQGKVVANIIGVTGVGDIGSSVYMSDDDTFTLTATGNILVGKVARYNNGTNCVISFKSSVLI